VAAGAAFDVTLADLPGAGYSWKPVDVPPGLTLVETRADAPATEIVGSAQRKVLRFRADLPGDYEVVFVFARPWEDAPAETQTVQVRVRPCEEREP
jgi:predicted secreted protein